jgi:Zn-dependent protease/CBS domain-containing protein
MQTAERSFLSGFPMGRLFGIEVRVHVSLVLIFGLIVLELGAAGLPDAHPEWPSWAVWVGAVVAGLGFFFSVLVHELGHALVARRRGMEITEIVLFLFGGVAQAHHAPSSPRSELLMALVGPFISLTLGLGCTALGAFLAGDALAEAEATGELAQVGPAATLLLWLGPINLVLAIFNLLPGFPLDGGRVLRALAWWITGSIEQATRWAAIAGRAVAWAIIAIGISMIFGLVWPVLGGGLVGGVWLVIVGWFLDGAAQASRLQASMRRVLEGVPVAELMHTGVATLAPDVHVDEVARRFVMHPDQRAFPVLVDDHMIGLVCIEDLHRAPHERWEATPVAAVMTPFEQLAIVGPDADASAAVEALTRRDVDQIPVVEGDRLRGVVRRADVLRVLEVHAPAIPA